MSTVETITAYYNNHSMDSQHFPQLPLGYVPGADEAVDEKLLEFLTTPATPLNPVGKGDYIPFDKSLIPAGIRDYVVNVSEVDQVDMGAAAAAAITTISSALGNRVSITPKVPKQGKPRWYVTPNLWGAIVGNPGSRKSAITSTFIEILDEHDDVLYKEHLAERAEWVTNGKKGHAPVAKSLIVSDATPESLAMSLEIADCPCIMFYRDELSGMINGMEKTYNNGLRRLLLEGWSGFGSHKVTRVTRETIKLKNFAISVFGGIQPDVLAQVVDKANNGSENDGFLQRFQMLISIKKPKPVKDSDKFGGSVSNKRSYTEVFERILDLPVKGGSVAFTADAQRIFMRWFDVLQERVFRMENNSDQNKMLTLHLSKYDSLVPSLALIFEAINNPGYRADNRGPYGGLRYPPVSVASVELAIRWAEFLERHARAIYGSADDHVISDEVIVAQRILSKVLKKNAGSEHNSIQAIDVKKLVRGKQDVKFFDSAMKVLVNFGHIFKYFAKDKGRSRCMYLLNLDDVNSELNPNERWTTPLELMTGVGADSNDTTGAGESEQPKTINDLPLDISPDMKVTLENVKKAKQIVDIAKNWGWDSDVQELDGFLSCLLDELQSKPARDNTETTEPVNEPPVITDAESAIAWLLSIAPADIRERVRSECEQFSEPLNALKWLQNRALNEKWGSDEKTDTVHTEPTTEPTTTVNPVTCSPVLTITNKAVNMKLNVSLNVAYGLNTKD